MSETSFFLKMFFKDKKGIGALAASSKMVVARVCSKINFARDIVVVEYGPGTGVFTKFLLAHLSPKSKLIAIDMNPEFIGFLQQFNDPRLMVIHDSAVNVQQILNKFGLAQADYVLSGIPCSLLPPDIKSQIVSDTWKVLVPGGKFLVYQYSYHMMQFLKQHFKQINKDVSVWNLPPTFIMEAIK